MPPADRTYPVVRDHVDGVVTAITALGHAWPVGEWKRPEELDSRFSDPPFALVRSFPSAGEFDGPLSDTQADITLRIQVIGVGSTQRQSLLITDMCRPAMQARLIPIPNRYIQTVNLMVVSGGVSRDDDLPIPFFNSSDIYELRTTPT